VRQNHALPVLVWGGRGKHDITGIKGATIVVVCDIDDKPLNEAKEKYSVKA